ncbi:hypothetical protein ACYUOO_004663 [Klebsiella aerogenes]
MGENLYAMNVAGLGADDWLVPGYYFSATDCVSQESERIGLPEANLPDRYVRQDDQHGENCQQECPRIGQHLS